VLEFLDKFSHKILFYADSVVEKFKNDFALNLPATGSVLTLIQQDTRMRSSLVEKFVCLGLEPALVPLLVETGPFEVPSPICCSTWGANIGGCAKSRTMAPKT
jgi:hypothetical protein